MQVYRAERISQNTPSSRVQPGTEMQTDMRVESSPKNSLTAGISRSLISMTNQNRNFVISSLILCFGNSQSSCEAFQQFRFTCSVCSLLSIALFSASPSNESSDPILCSRGNDGESLYRSLSGNQLGGTGGKQARWQRAEKVGR